MIDSGRFTVKIAIIRKISGKTQRSSEWLSLHLACMLICANILWRQSRIRVIKNILILTEALFTSLLYLKPVSCFYNILQTLNSIDAHLRIFKWKWYLFKLNESKNSTWNVESFLIFEYGRAYSRASWVRITSFTPGFEPDQCQGKNVRGYNGSISGVDSWDTRCGNWRSTKTLHGEEVLPN